MKSTVSSFVNEANHNPPPAVTSLPPPAAVAADGAPPPLLLLLACILHHVGRGGGAVRVGAAQSPRIGYHCAEVIREAELSPGDGHLTVGVVRGDVDG